MNHHPCEQEICFTDIEIVCYEDGEVLAANDEMLFLPRCLL